mgnify:CR=1 FL=1
MKANPAAQYAPTESQDESTYENPALGQDNVRATTYANPTRVADFQRQDLQEKDAWMRDAEDVSKNLYQTSQVKHHAPGLCEVDGVMYHNGRPSSR